MENITNDRSTSQNRFQICVIMLTIENWYLVDRLYTFSRIAFGINEPTSSVEQKSVGIIRCKCQKTGHMCSSIGKVGVYVAASARHCYSSMANGKVINRTWDNDGDNTKIVPPKQRITVHVERIRERLVNRSRTMMLFKSRECAQRINLMTAMGFV